MLESINYHMLNLYNKNIYHLFHLKIYFLYHIYIKEKNIIYYNLYYYFLKFLKYYLNIENNLNLIIHL